MRAAGWGCRAFSAAACLAALAACQTPAQPPVPAAPAAASAPSATASAAAPTPIGEQAIAGRITANTDGFASNSANAAVCKLPAQAVQIARFESGRYRIAASCEGSNAPRTLWVAAKDVDYTDAALAPALVRVLPQANVSLSMAYTTNRIFCDDKLTPTGLQQGACKITEPLYGQARCYAAPATAQGLARAAALLAQRDPSLSLKIMDCYRPVYVQQRMFALVADPKWVAEPKPPRYGGHNRAVAIDLTLTRNGVELDMGTPFDAFDEKSEYFADGRGISAVSQANRNILRQLMIDAGFRPYDGEWWHFSVPENTPALNFPL